MSKERMMILEMLESGKITPAEAQVLFNALGEEEHGDLEGTAELEAPHPPETVLPSAVNQPAESRPPRPEPDPQPAPAANTVMGKLARIFSKTPAPAPRDRRRRYPDPSYAVAMKRSGLDFSIDQLFRLQEEDIDPEQAAKMEAKKQQFKERRGKHHPKQS